MAEKTKLEDLRNVPVKAKREHSNPHGKKYKKARGDTYVHPRPEADIKAGLVEVVETETPTSPKSATTKTK